MTVGKRFRRAGTSDGALSTENGGRGLGSFGAPGVLSKSLPRASKLMAIAAMQTPDFGTISDFRKRQLGSAESFVCTGFPLANRRGIVALDRKKG